MFDHFVGLVLKGLNLDHQILPKMPPDTEIYVCIRNYPFNTYATFSEKLKFTPNTHTYVCAYVLVFRKNLRTYYMDDPLTRYLSTM